MAYIYDLVDTWNASGTTFTAVKMNVTDTASASGSLLMDLQVGAASKFSVRKDGLVNINGAAASIYVAGIGLSYAGSGLLSFGAGADVILSRRAAANLQFGAADAAAPVAQTLSVQSVVAGTTNTAGANLTITGSQGTGTGVGGSIIFQVAPLGSSGSAQNALATAWSISGAGNLLAGTDNTYDIGAAGATRPRDIFLGRNATIGGFVNPAYIRLITTLGTAETHIYNAGNGIFTCYDTAETSFNRIQLGGTSASFPALKRSTTSLQARLADDSAFTNIQGKLTTDTAYAAGTVVPTGVLTLYDSTGTAYRVPCLV